MKAISILFNLNYLSLLIALISKYLDVQPHWYFDSIYHRYFIIMLNHSGKWSSTPNYMQRCFHPPNLISRDISSVSSALLSETWTAGCTTELSVAILEEVAEWDPSELSGLREGNRNDNHCSYHDWRLSSAASSSPPSSLMAVWLSTTLWLLRLLTCDTVLARYTPSIMRKSPGRHAKEKKSLR